MIRRHGTGKVDVREQMRGGAGSVTIEHLWQPAEVTAKTRLFAQLTLAPGASIGFHEHTGEDEVLGFCGSTGSCGSHGSYGSYGSYGMRDIVPHNSHNSQCSQCSHVP